MISSECAIMHRFCMFFFLVLMFASVVATCGCKSTQPSLAWDLPGYQDWASAYLKGQSPSGAQLHPVWADAGATSRVVRAPFREAHLLFLEIYAQRLEARASESNSEMLSVVDSTNVESIVKTPSIQPVYASYVLTGTLTTTVEADPIANQRHLELLADAARTDSEWTHSRAPEITSTSTTSYRLRRKTMPANQQRSP
jgi:hypothetical protein